MSESDDCLFCKIIAGQIPSSKVYEDETTYAFNDINPKAKVRHLFLSGPKRGLFGLGGLSGAQTLTLAEGRAIPVDARAGFGRREPCAGVHPSANDVDGG